MTFTFDIHHWRDQQAMNRRVWRQRYWQRLNHRSTDSLHTEPTDEGTPPCLDSDDSSGQSRYS